MKKKRWRYRSTAQFCSTGKCRRIFATFDASVPPFQSLKTWRRPWQNASTSLWPLAIRNRTNTPSIFVKCVPMAQFMCSLQPLTVMQASADSLPLFNKLVCLMLHRFRRANVEISPFSTVKQQGCVLRIPTIESHVNLGERKVGNPRRAACKVQRIELGQEPIFKRDSDLQLYVRADQHARAPPRRCHARRQGRRPPPSPAAGSWQQPSVGMIHSVGCFIQLQFYILDDQVIAHELMYHHLHPSPSPGLESQDAPSKSADSPRML